jgi:hypothetical protein
MHEASDAQQSATLSIVVLRMITTPKIVSGLVRTARKARAMRAKRSPSTGALIEHGVQRDNLLLLKSRSISCRKEMNGKHLVNLFLVHATFAEKH